MIRNQHVHCCFGSPAQNSRLAKAYENLNQDSTGGYPVPNYRGTRITPPRQGFVKGNFKHSSLILVFLSPLIGPTCKSQ